MSECLDDAVLLGFVEQRLDGPTAARVERHIDACGACRRLLAMLAPRETRGRTLDGRWLLEEPIGVGSMGRVFAARDTQSGERVAVKLMRDGVPAQLERFAREAELLKRIAHPGVVGIREVLELDDGLALVMDLLEGISLEVHLTKRERETAGEARRIGIALAEAAGAAHAVGIVHRDVKPANVFLERGEPPRVRLLDFGLAKLIRADSAASTIGRLTASGTAIGTPAYMAPEQVRGEKDVDARADVWGVAAVMYRMLAGRAPVEGRSFGEVFRRLQAPVTPLGNVRPDVPAALCRVVDRALSLDREQRPADGTALARQL